MIKQREANRSPANPSLPRLLSEGDKLLKAIHNRLGFELHKMAETSKGAQTCLCREQFAVLALHTVEQLQDAHISETVGTLMEATTDRLVLVNTPEWRLAVGSIIAARLLEEGVLDQNKRIRLKFRECLEPLLGCAKASESLIQVANVQSRAWLLGLLADQLVEKAEPENVGAAAILAVILPDGHELCEKVIGILDAALMEYRGCVFRR